MAVACGSSRDRLRMAERTGSGMGEGSPLLSSTRSTDVASEGDVSVQLVVADVGAKELSFRWWGGAITMTWASFCFGMLFGSLSPVLGSPGECDREQRFFNCELGLSTATQSWWILLGPLVTVALGPVGGAALDRFGHRHMLHAAGIFYVLGWALFAATPGPYSLWPRVTHYGQGGSLAIVFVARMLTWTGFALMCGVPGIYLAEIAPAKLRGAVGATTAIAIMIGTLAEFGLGAWLDWRWLYLVNGLSFLPVLLLAFCLPPSPRWLQTRRQDQQHAALLHQHGSNREKSAVIQAVRHLYRPSDTREMIVEEVCKEMFASSNESTSKHTASGSNGENACHADSCKRLWQARLPVAMCGTLALVMQLCPGGTAAVQFSGPILGVFAPNVRNFIALLCNSAALPGSLLALLFVDCAGRLKLLVVSAVGQAVAALGLAYVLHQQSLSTAEDDSSSSSPEQGSSDSGSLHDAIFGFDPLNILAFVSLGGAQFCYTLGWGTVTGVLMSELMPAGVRGLGMAVAQSVRSRLIPCACQSTCTTLSISLDVQPTPLRQGLPMLTCTRYFRRAVWQTLRCQQSSSQWQCATVLPRCSRF